MPPPHWDYFTAIWAWSFQARTVWSLKTMPLCFIYGPYTYVLPSVKSWGKIYLLIYKTPTQFHKTSYCLNKLQIVCYSTFIFLHAYIMHMNSIKYTAITLHHVSCWKMIIQQKLYIVQWYLWLFCWLFPPFVWVTIFCLWTLWGSVLYVFN